MNAPVISGPLKEDIFAKCYFNFLYTLRNCVNDKTLEHQNLTATHAFLFENNNGYHMCKSKIPRYYLITHVLFFLLDKIYNKYEIII